MKILIILFFINFIKLLLCQDNGGTSDFLEIAKGPAFVDKTMLINTFFTEAPYAVLITAPRRFGKTVNMDMVKRFSEIVVDGNGTRVRPNETENYRTFTSKYKKSVNGEKEHLDVFKDKEFFDKHFGKYPVIHLDFKELAADNLKKYKIGIRKIIQKVFISHEYLKFSDKLDEEDKSKFINGYQDMEIWGMVEPELYIWILVKLLKTHFNEKVVVLIDNFDVPIQCAIFNARKKVKDILRFMIDISTFIYNLIKTNNCVRRAFLTGCLSLAGDIAAATNNIQQYKFGQNHNFSSYYGFTLKETSILAKKFDMSDKMADIKAHYDGYVVVGSDLKLLNPFSIVNCVCTKEIGNARLETGFLQKFKLSFLNEGIGLRINNLLNNQTIATLLHNNIHSFHVKRLSKLVEKGKYGEETPEIHSVYLQLMLELGYLTRLGEQGHIAQVIIPNKEVNDELTEYMRLAYVDLFNLTNEDIQQYINSIVALGTTERSYEEFGESLSNLFTELPRNEGELNAAQFIFAKTSHVFEQVAYLPTVKIINGIPAYLGILIVTRNNYTGLIIESRYYKNATDNISPDEPLKEIVTKEYFNILKHYKVKNTILLAVSFKQEDRETGKPQIILSYLYNTIDLKENVTVIINVKKTFIQF